MSYTGPATATIVGSTPGPDATEPVPELSILYDVIVQYPGGGLARFSGVTSDVQHWPDGVLCFPPRWDDGADHRYPAHIDAGRVTIDIGAKAATIECSGIAEIVDETIVTVSQNTTHQQGQQP